VHGSVTRRLVCSSYIAATFGYKTYALHWMVVEMLLPILLIVGGC
jgi:hypothetical protein